MSLAPDFLLSMIVLLKLAVRVLIFRTYDIKVESYLSEIEEEQFHPVTLKNEVK